MKPLIIKRNEVNKTYTGMYNRVAMLAFEQHPTATMLRIKSYSGTDLYQDCEVCVNGMWLSIRVQL